MISDDPLRDIILLAASIGVAGVFLTALFERIVPLLPSQGLFAAIGIAAAEGLWCLPTAVIASVLGSGAGAFAAYGAGVGATAGRVRSMRIRRLLRRRDRVGRYLRRTIHSSEALPYITQLLPGARHIGPLVAGAMRHDRRRFAIATMAGLTVWNVSFIAIGYVMARLGGPTNVTAASMMILALVGCLLMTIRLIRGARARASRRDVPNRYATLDRPGDWRR